MPACFSIQKKTEWKLRSILTKIFVFIIGHINNAAKNREMVKGGLKCLDQV